jgi:sugar phosphate isomerase/epimerase
MTYDVMVSRTAAAPILGFSTLGCPEWEATRVVEEAARMGFTGIEWRGGPDGHVVALPPAELRDLRRRMDDHGLVAIAVTAYTTFVDPDASLRRTSVDDLVRHAEIAAELGAADVRAFPGERADDASDAVLRDRAAEGLVAAGERIRGMGVVIALEPHDDLVASASVRPLLERVGGPAIGVIWDVGNSWAAGDEPEAALALLRPWLRYVQVKDGVGRGPNWRLTRVGEGEVPLGDALRALLASGPLPSISIEWERPWHPELPPAADALPAGLAHIRGLLEQMDEGPPS